MLHMIIKFVTDAAQAISMYDNLLWVIDYNEIIQESKRASNKMNDAIKQTCEEARAMMKDGFDRAEKNIQESMAKIKKDFEDMFG